MNFCVCHDELSAKLCNLISKAFLSPAVRVEFFSLIPFECPLPVRCLIFLSTSRFLSSRKFILTLSPCFVVVLELRLHAYLHLLHFLFVFLNCRSLFVMSLWIVAECD